ncbi:MAG: hypothetical protein ACLS9K_03575 [Lachnospira eligens]
MNNDFSQGKVWKNVINQAIPLMVAQLIQILYNVVDRIYIGHLRYWKQCFKGDWFSYYNTCCGVTNLFSRWCAALFYGKRSKEKKAEL